MKKYLMRTSSTGYAILFVDSNEDVEIQSFRDDRGMSVLALVHEVHNTPEIHRTFWQLQLQDCIPLKAQKPFAGGDKRSEK